MKSFRENPEGAENQEASRENEWAVFAAKMMAAPIHPVIGALRPYRLAAEVLGEGAITGFELFESDTGVGGLAKVNGSELHILALHSNIEGVGQFRDFIAKCQQHYQFIRLWTIMNELLPSILARYGFVSGHDVDQFGQMQSVLDWSKP